MKLQLNLLEREENRLEVGLGLDPQAQGTSIRGREDRGRPKKGEVRLCRPCQHKQQKVQADWGKEERIGRSRHDLGSCLAKTSTNPSQYSSICPTPSEHFAPCQKPLQLDACPATDISPTTKSPPAQAPAPARPYPAGDFDPGTSSNPGRNPPVKKLPEFALILMSYGDLLPSLITNQLVVVIPGRIY